MQHPPPHHAHPAPTFTRRTAAAPAQPPATPQQKIQFGVLVFFAALVTILVVIWGNSKKPTPPPTPAVSPVARQTRQQRLEDPTGKLVAVLPDCPATVSTPCEVEIKQIHDLYTDGQPVWVLPPGWDEDKAILYEGNGHFVIKGTNIHPGVWKFWAAETEEEAAEGEEKPAANAAEKVVKVRVFARNN